MIKVVKNIILGLVAFLWLAAPGVFAAPSYSLVAPATGITRGQNVQFTVRIDTAGETVTATNIGLRYDNTYLKYVGVAAGDATTTVTADDNGSELVITGNSNSFTGEGVYATVTFNIVADAPGGTQICSIFTPSNGPSTSSGVASSSSPTTQARPATLPQSGAAETTLLAVIAATVALSGGFILRRHA